MGVTGELYGCVVVAQFAAQAMLRTRPDLHARPVVVLEGVSPMERVCACNGKAAALGVQEGMTRVEVETFGVQQILSRIEAEEDAAKKVLRQVMGEFTPRLEERGQGVAWACVLDLSGTERLLGKPEVLSRKIQASLAELGFEACVVLCANADAGLSLARMGKGRVVMPGGEAAALAALPVSALGLDEDQQERFAIWGIRTLEELAALPEVELIARMGQAGGKLRLRARGELPHLLEPTPEVFRLDEMLEFDEPVETLEPLLFCMNVMLERLVSRAQERALAIASVTVSLWVERCADRTVGEHDSIAANIKLPATYEEMPLMKMSKLQPAAMPGAAPDLPSRLGMASADASVRKAWHRAALFGERPTIEDLPRVRGEASRARLGIGDGQAMQRASSKLHLVEQNQPNLKNGLHRASLSSNTLQVEDQIGFPGINRNKPQHKAEPWADAFERTIQPAIPLVDRALLLKMLQLDLEAHPAPGYVIRVGLAAKAGLASRIQLGLFAPPMPEPTRFEDTHARLASLVGTENIGQVKPLDTHAAESFALERFRLPGVIANGRPEYAVCHPPAIALRRMRSSSEIRVMMQGRRISAFWLSDSRFEVERCYGPWRSSGKWWGQEIWSTDAWDVAARSLEEELLICLVSWDFLRCCWLISGIYD